MVDSFEPKPQRFNHGVQAEIHFLGSFGRKVTSSDARLIGNHDHAVSMRVPPTERVRGIRLEFQQRRIIHISAIKHQGTVAIQDDYFVGFDSGTHDLDNTAARLTVSVVLWPLSSSASTTLPPRASTKSAPTTVSSV